MGLRPDHPLVAVRALSHAGEYVGLGAGHRHTPLEAGHSIKKGNLLDLRTFRRLGYFLSLLVPNNMAFWEQLLGARQWQENSLGYLRSPKGRLDLSKRCMIS